MADMLCAPDDLATLLGKTLDAAKAIQLVEMGTAVVQAATAKPLQRIVLVEGDVAQVQGGTDGWLWLPQWPTRAVNSVTVDGTALTEGTDYRRFGSRLFSRRGWAVCWGEPSLVEVDYDHGYAAEWNGDASTDQGIQPARQAVLSIIKGAYDNPTGVLREAIDDYSVAYGELQAEFDASPFLTAQIRRVYGYPAGFVRA